MFGALCRRLQGRRHVAGHRRSGGLTYDWPEASTYVQNPPYFDGMTTGGAPPKGHRRMPASWACSATRSPPTTSPRPVRSRPTARQALPAGSIRRRTARLQLLRRAPRQPRGDDARHLRQYPHQEPDAPGRRRRRTPSTIRPAKQMPIYDAAMKYRPKRTPRWSSSPARNTAPARRATGRPRAPACSASKRRDRRGSFERIHRSNLVGMGVTLPLQFGGGTIPKSQIPCQL
jgi:aconitate hydratase